MILSGKTCETTYNDNSKVEEGVILNQEDDCYGVNILKNIWHILEALVPNSVIFDCKKGPFVEHEEKGILTINIQENTNNQQQL